MSGMVTESERERILQSLQIAQLLRYHANAMGEAAISANPTDSVKLKLSNDAEAQADSIVTGVVDILRGRV